jgi:hypothetical protein
MDGFRKVNDPMWLNDRAEMLNEVVFQFPGEVPDRFTPGFMS